MLEFVVAFLGELARVLAEAVVGTFVPQPDAGASASARAGAGAVPASDAPRNDAGPGEAPTTSTSRASDARALPSSDALRAMFASDRPPPADWLARVRDASGPSLAGGISPTRNAPNVPTPQAPPSESASAGNPDSAASGARESASRAEPAPPQTPTTSEPPAAPASANEAHAEVSPDVASIPDVIRAERTLNPNFGGEPATPHPVAHTWDTLPISPGRPDLAPQPPSETTPAAATESLAPTHTASDASSDRSTPTTAPEPAFVAQERALNPNFGRVPDAPHPVARTWDRLPPSPARSGTVDPHDFALAGLASTAHRPSGPHAWDSLPLSPARAGDQGAHAAPGNPSTATHPGNSESASHTTTSAEAPAWPTLPRWPPQRAGEVFSRRNVRDSAEPSWYV